MKILKHHSVTHTIVGIIIQAVTWLITGSVLLGAIIASAFYTARECYQYKNGKRHKGRFDYEGFIPVTVIVFLIALIAHAI